MPLVKQGFSWHHDNLGRFMTDLDKLARGFDQSERIVERYGKTTKVANNIQAEFHEELEVMAKRLIGVTDELGVWGEASDDAVEAQEALGELVLKVTDAFLEQDEALDETSDSLEDVADKYKGLDDGMDRTTVGMRTTTRATRETDGATRSAAGGFSMLGGAATLLSGILMGVVVGAVSALTRGLMNLATEGVKALAYLATAPLRALRDLAELGFNALAAAASVTIDVLQGVASATVNMAIGVARAFAGMITNAVDFGIRYESAFAGVLKTTDGLQDDLGNLTLRGQMVTKAFDQLALRVPMGMEGLLRIAEIGGQFNIGELQLVGFAETIAAVVASTTLSVDEAALAFGRFGTVFGIVDTEYDSMASALVWLGNNMGVLEKDVVAVTERLAGAAQAAGFTVDETLGISAAFLRVGMKPQAAASSIQKVMLDINKAVNLGSEDLDTFATLSGRTAEEFAAEWRADPAVVFADFVHGLGMAGNQADIILEDLGLSSIRVRQGFLGIAKAPDILTDALIGSNRAMEENTALAREAGIRYSTTASQIQLVKNRMDLLSKAIYNKLAPAYQSALSFGRMFTEYAMKALRDVLKDIQPFLDTVTLQIQNLTAVFEEGGPRAFADELMRMTGFDSTTIEKVNLFIDRILQGLQGAGSWIADNWEGAVKWVSAKAEEVVNWFIDHWPTIETEIQKVITWVRDYDWKELWDRVWIAGGEVVDWFVDNWPTIKQTVIDTYNEILDFLFGPELGDVPEFAPAITFGADEEQRLGGFIDGLIEGFDELQTSAIDAGLAIKDALESTIVSLGIILGMEEDAGPKEAGRFVAARLADIFDMYKNLWTAVAAVADLLSGQPLRYSETGQFAEVQERIDASRQQEPLIDQERFPKMFQREQAVEGESLLDTIIGAFSGIGDAIGPGLTAAYSLIHSFITDTVAGFMGLNVDLVGGSIIPDMMDAIVAVFETGLTDISAMWTTFWTGVTTEAGFGVDTALDALGVETGSTGGLLGAIERSLPGFREAGRKIARAVSDGILESVYMMVDALASNINAMNVAVESDETINKVLFEIGEKIVRKIANAIIKSYQIILDALEFAMSLGGQLINQAAAAAQNIRDNARGGSPDVSTPTSPAGATPYTPPSYPQGRYGVTSDVQVGPNYVRDSTDMANLEDVARRAVQEQLRA